MDLADAVKPTTDYGPNPHYQIIPVVEHGAGGWVVSPLALARVGPEWAPGSSLTIKTRLTSARPLRVRALPLFCEGRLLRMRPLDPVMGIDAETALELTWVLKWHS